MRCWLEGGVNFPENREFEGRVLLELARRQPGKIWGCFFADIVIHIGRKLIVYRLKK
jgi:hypothetical protein